MNSFLSPRAMMGAAIVGLVGAAGMFIYEQVYAEKRRTMLLNDMARLDRQVASMRAELETLRELQKESQLKRQKHKKLIRQRAEAAKATKVAKNESVEQVDAPEVSYASDSEYFTDYQSVVGTDLEMDSEEFYDVHSESDKDDTLCDTLPLSNGDAKGGKGDGLDREEPAKEDDTKKST